MTSLTKLASIAALTLTTATATFAGQKENVQVFYDLLSNPSSASHAEAFLTVTTEDWESIGDYSGKNKSREGLLAQVAGFGKLIPDLNWKVEAMHQEGDTIVVRSRATGTPVGPLFGVDGQGRGFEILTIDIHELEGDMISRTYHVEDWSGALQQLSRK